MKQPPLSASRRRQAGVVLFIVLIVLVAMTFASVALVRSVDTTALISGNLAFRESATASGDTGAEIARNWLVANFGSAVLDQDSPANAYYATDQETLDLTGNATPGNAGDDVDWDGGTPGAAAHAVFVIADGDHRDAAGNVVSYVIHRLCRTPGPLNGASCASGETATGGGSTKGGGGYKPLSGVLQGYYRVTSRISGPRNTTSYVQTIIAL